MGFPNRAATSRDSTLLRDVLAHTLRAQRGHGAAGGRSVLAASAPPQVGAWTLEVDEAGNLIARHAGADPVVLARAPHPTREGN